MTVSRHIGSLGTAKVERANRFVERPSTAPPVPQSFLQGGEAEMSSFRGSSSVSESVDEVCWSQATCLVPARV